MRPRYVVRISAADVGRRVTVRSRRSGPLGEGEPTLTDTIGRLCSWREGVLEIEVRDGSRRQIREADVVAGRVLPESHRRSR